MKILQKVILVVVLVLFGVGLVAVSIWHDQANTIKIKPLGNQSWYLLEMIEDRVADWLTFDPNQKVRLWFEYADQRWLTADTAIRSHQEAAGWLVARKAVGYQSKATDVLIKMKLDDDKQKILLKESREALQRAIRLIGLWKRDSLVTNWSEYDSLSKELEELNKQLLNLGK